MPKDQVKQKDGSPEDSETAEQEQSEFREISADELKRILDDHERWIDTEGKEGKKADLENVKGLAGADLRYANLEGATGLLGNELAQADLTGTKLPKDIRELKTLDVVKETSQNARKIFFATLLGCVYSWLTIATTTDVRLLTNSASSPLPIIGTEIPIAWFYFAAPLVLLAIYFYFHLYLQKLWEGLAGLPAIFPDGKRLDERAYPWLLNSIVRRHFKILKKKRPGLTHLQEWVSILLAWWIVPFTLAGFWLRYLPRHEWIGTWLHIGLFVLSVSSAAYFYHGCAITLRGEGRKLYLWKTLWQDRRFYYAGIVTLAGFLFFLLSYGAIEGVQIYRQRDLNLKDVKITVPFIFQKLGFSLFADLEEADISNKPLNWRGVKEEPVNVSTEPINWSGISAEELNLVKGGRLKGCNLRFANARYAFLIRADLRGADLTGADLTRADLRGADLKNATLIGARLYRADLRNADLRGAVLNEANFLNADLRGSKLSGTESGSPDHRAGILPGRTELEGTILTYADLRGADLRGSTARQANIHGADLRGSLIYMASFEKADLTEANLHGVDFSDVYVPEANFRGADLRGAKLTGAMRLTKEQIEPAVIDKYTQLPDAFRK